MKKKAKGILMAMVMTSVMVALAGGAEGVKSDATVEEKLHKQISVQIVPEQLKIEKIDDFDWISLPTRSHISKQGEPALPIKSIVVKLPRNTQVISINAIETASSIIPGNYKVSPALEPKVISDKNTGTSSLSKPHPGIYGSSNPYPSNLFDVYNSKGRDYNYVIIYFYPVQYVPAKGRLTLTTEATFDIEYTTETGSSAASEIQPLVNLEEIIITAPAYQTEANELAEWRTLTGIETAVFNTTWIYNNYEGVDKPQEIRNFINDTFTANSTLKYVLLFGDVNVTDPEVADNYSVPTRLAWIPDGYDDAGSGVDGTLVPTDYYYECLDGTWDTNGDEKYADLANDNFDIIDFIPDVSVGRLSVNDEANANQVVNKIIQYEQNIDQDWFEKMILVGTDTFRNYRGPEGEVLKEYSQDIVEDNFTDFIKLYETQYTLSSSAISENINSGSGAVNFAGHGGYGVWSLGNAGYYRNSDVRSLNNGNELPIICTMACLTGGFDSVYNTGNCIGEEFLRNPNGGSIAYVGATRVAWVWVGHPKAITSGLAGELDWRFWESFSLGITKPGPMLSEAKIRYIFAHPINNVLDEKTILEYVLLGDPATSEAPPLLAPSIIGYAPESSVYDVEGATQTFNITVDQTVNVSWQINGTEVGTNESVTEASYTNTSAAIGSWNVLAVVENENGTAMQTWEWIVTLPPPPPAPNIVSFAPESPVNNGEGDTREFNITVDQTVNVTWLINGTKIFSQDGVTESTYTSESATSGTWIVSAVAENENGTAMQTWEWIVTFPPPPPAPNIVSFAPESSVNNEEGDTREFNITVDQTVNVTWLINGTKIFSQDGVTESTYTSESATSGTWIVSAVAENENGTAMQTWEWIVTETHSMHVSNISMSMKNAGKNKNAIATVTIVDAKNSPVEGAIVSGQWSNLTIDHDFGITDANGMVSMKSDKVKVSSGIFTFTVDDVSLSGWSYNPSTNNETSDYISI